MCNCIYEENGYKFIVDTPYLEVYYPAEDEFLFVIEISYCPFCGHKQPETKEYNEDFIPKDSACYLEMISQEEWNEILKKNPLPSVPYEFNKIRWLKYS